MKIVIATPILFDKMSPFNHLFKDIIEGFLNDGHEIIRIVACKNEYEDDYKMGIEHENIRYIPIVRKTVEHGNIIKRYFMDTLTAIKMARKIKKLKSADVLFEDVCYSSFWTVEASKKKNMKVIAILQDVWPDNAVQSRLIKKSSILYFYFEIWQKYVYKRANRLICISDDMKAFIQSKNIDEKKIDVIYNWGYSDEIIDIPWEENKFVEKYQLSPNKFYAVYAGNIGRMQNVQLVVEAAKMLQYNVNIHFLIVGDGVMRKEIKKLSEGMENVTMLPFQPPELAIDIYSMAGVNIVPMVPGGLKSALPSKIGVCLSCGNPIIACVDHGSQLEEMFSEYGCGQIANPRNAEDLANKIIHASIERKEKNYKCFMSKFLRSKNIAEYCTVVGVNK